MKIVKPIHTRRNLFRLVAVNALASYSILGLVGCGAGDSSSSSLPDNSSDAKKDMSIEQVIDVMKRQPETSSNSGRFDYVTYVFPGGTYSKIEFNFDYQKLDSIKKYQFVREGVEMMTVYIKL